MSDTIDSRELRDTMRGFLAHESNPTVVRAIAKGDAALKSNVWKKMSELGWLGLGIPEQQGGLGLGPHELAVAYEEFGRALSPLPFMSQSLAAQAIMLGGDDAQRLQWLPRIASGAVTATLALPGLNGTVHLSGAGSESTITGMLRHVPDPNSELLLVPCVGATTERALLLLETRCAGVSIVEHATVDVTRVLGEVSFAGAAASPGQMMRMSDGAWTALGDLAALAIACDSIGGSAHILEKTVDYMKTRTQFGRPIGSFQALKHRCASWKILLEAAEALTRDAAVQMTEGLAGRSMSASRAKYYAADAFAAIAGDAIQLHGGIGFTWDHDCHLFLKRGKLNQQIYGNATLHRERIAAGIFSEFRLPEGV